MGRKQNWKIKDACPWGAERLLLLFLFIWEPLFFTFWRRPKNEKRFFFLHSFNIFFLQNFVCNMILLPLYSVTHWPYFAFQMSHNNQCLSRYIYILVLEKSEGQKTVIKIEQEMAFVFPIHFHLHTSNTKSRVLKNFYVQNFFLCTCQLWDFSFPFISS